MIASGSLAGKAWAGSGVLTATPATFSLAQNSTLYVDIREDSASTPVKAVEVDLNYPTQSLEVESIDTAGSGFDVQQVNSVGGGEVRIVRSASTPLTGDQRVARILVKGIGLGQSKITLGAGSSVTGSDGQDVLVTSLGFPMVTVGVTTPFASAPKADATSVQSAPADDNAATPVQPAATSASNAPAGSGSGDTAASTSKSGALPDTGAADTVGGAIGLVAIGYTGWLWKRSRKNLGSALRQS
jgi:LPXTG-motif cell wall-anchored protein